MKYKRILFICSGNRCRSPMAKAIFEEMINQDTELQAAGISAQSAGTLDMDSLEPTEEAIQIMRERGLSITGHRSRVVSKEIEEWADIILVMEHKHRHYIATHFPHADRKVALLTEFVGKDEEVPDPIRCGIETYRECADLLESLLSVVVENLKAG